MVVGCRARIGGPAIACLGSGAIGCGRISIRSTGRRRRSLRSRTRSIGTLLGSDLVVGSRARIGCPTIVCLGARTIGCGRSIVRAIDRGRRFLGRRTLGTGPLLGSGLSVGARARIGRPTIVCLGSSAPRRSSISAGGLSRFIPASLLGVSTVRRFSLLCALLGDNNSLRGISLRGLFLRGNILSGGSGGR